MRFLTLVALLVMLWVPVDGVAQRNPLTGLTTMYHLIDVAWPSDITGTTEEQYRQELENAFELGLLRAGVRLADEPGPYLSCNSTLVVTADGNSAARSRIVEYREAVVPWAGAGLIGLYCSGLLIAPPKIGSNAFAPKSGAGNN
jgi:hypothetical protein